MTLVRKQLAASTKRPLAWTAFLERMIVEFLDLAKPALSSRDFDEVCLLPGHIVDLVQACALEGIELKAGEDTCLIRFTADPHAADDLDLSDLAPRPGGGRLEVTLILRDVGLAQALGAPALRRLAGRTFGLSFRAADGQSPHRVLRDRPRQPGR